MSKICYHDPDKPHTRDDQSWKGLDPQKFWNDYLALPALYPWEEQSPELVVGSGELSWWPNDKESALQAGDTGLVPGWGTKTPHVAEQLSPSATITEPASPGVCALQREATAMRSWCTAMKRKPELALLRRGGGVRGAALGVPGPLRPSSSWVPVFLGLGTAQCTPPAPGTSGCDFCCPPLIRTSPP